MTSTQQLIGSAFYLIQLLLPIIAMVLLVVFFWGLGKFVYSAGNPEARVEGRRLMLWGILALFVMVAVWGIVFFIGSNLGINQGGVMQYNIYQQI